MPTNSLSRYGLERTRMAHDLEHNDDLALGRVGLGYVGQFELLEAKAVAAGVVRPGEALLICGGTANSLGGEMQDGAVD